MAIEKITRCPACGGKGKNANGKRCATCLGKGEVTVPSVKKTISTRYSVISV